MAILRFFSNLVSSVLCVFYPSVPQRWLPCALHSPLEWLQNVLASNIKKMNVYVLRCSFYFIKNLAHIYCHIPWFIRWLYFRVKSTECYKAFWHGVDFVFYDIPLVLYPMSNVTTERATAVTSQSENEFLYPYCFGHIWLGSLALITTTCEWQHFATMDDIWKMNVASVKAVAPRGLITSTVTVFVS